MSSPVRLIGLLGGSGHGKTTLGDMLGRQAGKATTLEYGAYVISFANKWGIHWPVPAESGYSIKRIHEIGDSLAVVLNKYFTSDTGQKLTAALVKDAIVQSQGFEALKDYLRSDNFPRNITMANRGQHRALLEFIGTFLMELVADDIWDQLLEPDLCLALGRHDLVTVCIRLPPNAALMRTYHGVVVKVVNDRVPAKPNPTEARMAEISPDVIIHNDSNLLALERTAKVIWSVLQHEDYHSGKMFKPIRLFASDYLDT